MYRDLLKVWGYQVITANDGQEALKKFKKAKKIDLVVTDFMMPKMNGLELLRQIKALNKEVVVIVVTGTPSLEHQSAAIKAGAYKFLVKPVNLVELKRVISSGLSPLI